MLCAAHISSLSRLASRCVTRTSAKRPKAVSDSCSESSGKELQKQTKLLHPAVEGLRAYIESRPELRMCFHKMWEDAKNIQFDGHVIVRDYQHMLELLSHFVQSPPPWSPATSMLGSSGLPFSDIFYYAVLTPSGYAALTDAGLTAHFKKLLETWCAYLSTPASAVGLETWLSGRNGCLDKLVESANAPKGTSLTFEELFVCDAHKKYFGFRSWDDFFVREFRPHLRPVCQGSSSIASACESMPLTLVRNVKLQDEFWLKGSAYSLVDMFKDRALAQAFEGGTVYQAFLSQYSYHRWHAPISGKIKHCYRIDGTYFAVPRFEEPQCPIETGLLEVERCQVALTSLSSRAVITIQSDNPKIGLVAFIGVGLHEVSTTEITVSAGQRVRKGEELGMFHFGGSTHCLIFQRHVEVLDFPMDSKTNVPVKSALARIL